MKRLGHKLKCLTAGHDWAWFDVPSADSPGTSRDALLCRRCKHAP
jgi:hypothetical protein